MLNTCNFEVKDCELTVDREKGQGKHKGVKNDVENHFRMKDTCWRSGRLEDWDCLGSFRIVYSLLILFLWDEASIYSQEN